MYIDKTAKNMYNTIKYLWQTQKIQYSFNIAARAGAGAEERRFMRNENRKY